MNLAWFRFHEELNDFLPVEKRKVQFSYSFRGNPSVKDAIEASGIPHVEVGRILVNGNPVDFTYTLHDSDKISVYPVSGNSYMTGAGQMPLNEARFISDVHLGKLVKYLRLCGFDTFYDKSLDDRQIVKMASAEKRIVLTRDKLLLKNKNVIHGYWIRSQIPERQIMETIKRFDLREKIMLFTRCLECNTILEDTGIENVKNLLQPRTRKYYMHFKICPGCHRVYWEGSHYIRMKKNIIDLLEGE